ncbi:hypothetical protein Cylst_4609 [Cylindrospermum stagnale PCC 7417]|uniref:Uncharacterized protein n=1 Tax=Cylindrospermum stagnale PCC 7417 TaxID=56107 RepID=K9X3L6_9NOST|nr:hypothetical protein [Cylindrospermum stagnale]AFZ26679.1 hypothetical protein Cylst_4609 [Cylindrospermum stagnale PCC 7417]
MNEVDTLNNGTVIETVNSANSPESEQATCPFYSVVPHEDQTVKNLPMLKPAAPQVYETTVVEIVEDTTPQDWVAEPEKDSQALIDSEFQQLLALNDELRGANSELYEQVEQLKNELAESEKVFQWQKTRFSVTESMLNQQTQELAAAQEQIKSLFQQLETAVQTVQHQEIFIETFKGQLQISQQRLGLLERECSLLQSNYSDQCQQISQSENTCRELRTRLMRQQRQTLQFKAALEKCLDTPVPSYDALDDTANHPHDIAGGQSRFSRKARSLFPNAQPIKPWSAEPESVSGHLDNSWGESSTPAYRKNYPAPVPSSPENLANQQVPPTAVETAPTPEIDDSPTTPADVLASGSTNLDQQLDSLIQMFFVSQPASTSPADPVAENNTDSRQAEAPIWETLATLEDDQEPETGLQEQFEAEINPAVNTYTTWVVDSPISLAKDSQASAASPDIETTAVEIEDYWLETPQLPASDVSPEPLSKYISDSKSPSPVVYPERPPKGRKSLASVELPNFRQKGN